MNLNKIIHTAAGLVLLITTVTAAQNCRAKVNIKSDDAGSAIYINNVKEGTGSLVTWLTPGRYELVINKPGKDWGMKSYRDTINIMGCDKEINVNYSFRNYRYIDSEPQDAEVIAGDSTLGYTPLFIPMQFRQLTLKKKNYLTRDVEIDQTKSSNIVKLQFTGKPAEESFYKKPVFKYLLGGIVVLGAATAYLKIKADNSFRDYQRTDDNSYLDDTHKYDLLSGITFGALQINLGFLIYYFLSD